MQILAFHLRDITNRLSDLLLMQQYSEKRQRTHDIATAACKLSSSIMVMVLEGEEGHVGVKEFELSLTWRKRRISDS